MNAPADGVRTSELASRLGGELIGSGDVFVTNVSSLAEADEAEIAFIASPQYLKQWPDSRASAVLVDRTLHSDLPSDPRPAILVDNVELATAELLRIFAPVEPSWDVGIHASACVDPTSEIAPSARIGPNVVVGPRCRIEDDVVLHPGVCVYAGSRIGPRTALHSGVVIRSRCAIGADVIIHQNASIGADGFGYRPTSDGSGLVKMPHNGRVVIEDRVEIGASTCVDRGKFGDTTIGFGTKVDNLVQIAHNCRIGRHCVIAGGTALAGSVVLEDWVMLGGQVGIIEHARIGRGAKIGAQAGVGRDVPPGGEQTGSPADDAHAVLRQIAALRKLPRLMKRLSSQPGRAGKGDASQGRSTRD